ncbi:MAG: rod shape-determining protein MreD [Paludibacteraceae bacterium]|nr:rod shape-determining protein MreD [Paludibacteraceae bacterium]
MRNLTLKYSVKFVCVLLLQVLLFNNIDFLGYISPYIYLIFFFDLPVNFKTPYSMLLGFLMGFLVDIFGNTMGVHTFACVLFCFLRNAWIDLLFSALNTQQNELTPIRVGWIGYVKYVTGLVFVHHAALFLLEAFSFDAFAYTLIRILANTVVSILLILFYEYFRSK